MDIDLDKARKRARTSSLVAALLIFAIAALSAAILALYLYAQSRVGSYEYLQHGWIENKIASLTMPVLASLLFASFFLHIHRSEKPFGSSQSLKLGIAGVLLGIKYALDCIRPGIPPIPVPPHQRNSVYRATGHRRPHGSGAHRVHDRARNRPALRKRPPGRLRLDSLVQSRIVLLMSKQCATQKPEVKRCP